MGDLLIATQGRVGALAVPVAGLVWGLLSGVALFFYNVLPGKPLARHGSFLVYGLSMLIAGLIALIIFRPWETPIVLPMRGWLVYAGIVVIGTMVANLLFVPGIKDAGPLLTGLLGTVEPVSGIVISALWLHTPVSPWDVAGAVAIVVMVLLVTPREQAGSALATEEGTEADD